MVHSYVRSEKRQNKPNAMRCCAQRLHPSLLLPRHRLEDVQPRPLESGEPGCRVHKFASRIDAIVESGNDTDLLQAARASLTSHEAALLARRRLLKCVVASPRLCRILDHGSGWAALKVSTRNLLTNSHGEMSESGSAANAVRLC